MKWNHIIEDESIKEHLLCIIRSIAKDLATCSMDYPGLLDGESGISLFWEYLFLYTKDNEHHNNCKKSVKYSLSAISDKPLSYNFSAGISGISWAFCHLVNRNSIKANIEHIIDNDINGFLFKCTTLDLEAGNYDYLHHGLSTLLYFLELPFNAHSSINFRQLIKLLENASLHLHDGIVWADKFSKEARLNKGIIYNLGLAHGMPSIIVLLSKVFAKDIETEKCYKLLYGNA